MTPKNSLIRRISFLVVAAILSPICMWAGCNISFADLGLDDGTPCSLPLQNEKLAISFKDGKGKFNARKNIMAFSKGTSITIKAKEGENITGILLKTKNKSKSDNIQLFSSETGKCQRGLWTGSANTVTIKCLQDCDISGIKAAFSSDQPEAYAVKNWYFADTDSEGSGYDFSVKLVFYYDGNKSLYEDHVLFSYDGSVIEENVAPFFYSIEGNTFYPPWYGDQHIDRFEFDPSFANFRPKRTSHWFDGFNSNIKNLQYLNTSETLDMSYMFANFNYEINYSLDHYDDIEEICPINEEYDHNLYTDVYEYIFSSIFEYLDFSSVQNVSNMFSGCGMKRFVLSTNNAASINRPRGMFENSNVELVTLTSNDINVKDGFFEGLGTVDKPCAIDAPDDYDFGVETSVKTFQWKGGIFDGLILQGYVLCANHQTQTRAFTSEYSLTFYYDKKRHTREKKGYNIVYGINEEFYSDYWSELTLQTFDLNEGSDDPLWLNYFDDRRGDYWNWNNYSTSTIRFDKSFADCRPKSTYRWFDFGGIKAKTTNGYNISHDYNIIVNYFNIIRGDFSFFELEGLQYLNTSETTNTERMFFGFLHLDSLDLSYQDFSKVVNSKYMLADCYSLQKLIINSTWSNLDSTACTGTGDYNPCMIIAPSGFDFKTYTNNDCFIWKNGSFILPDIEAKSQSRGYAEWNDSTLTLYYDNKCNEHQDYSTLNRFYNNDFMLYYSHWSVDWDNPYYINPFWRNSTSIKKVIIDPSLSNKLGETIGWFYHSSLETIQGMEYLCSTNMHSMFSKCTSLKTINLTGCDMTETTDTEDWFYGCTSLTDITLPNTCSIIGVSAFENCTSLPSIIIPESVKAIGDAAFNGCTNLATVTVMNPTPVSITESTFSNRRNATLIVPAGARDAYLAADYWKEFKEIKESPNIIFADANVKAICVANWDTNSDGELNEMEASKVTFLGTLFKKSNISSFKELQYFTSLMEIGEGAFASSTVKEITLPKNITTLKKDAFLFCNALTSLHLPAKVKEIGLNALSGCTAMTSITVDEDNLNFCDIDGVLFSKEGETLLQFPAAKSPTYNVPEGTTTLARDAFYMSQLETVELPSSLKEIGYDAFGWSRQLTGLVIPEGVTVIGDYIFDGCNKLTSLHIPASVTSIGQYMSNGCKALTDVWSHSKKPFAINSNNFTTNTYANATLHVPYGTRAVYEGTDGWKNFAHIVDDIAASTLLVEDITINLGYTRDLMVGLSNNEKIDGVQFDLTLPAGISIATDKSGEYLVETTDRSKKLYTECEKLGDNLYRIILMSTKRETIDVGDGSIINIRLACEKDATPGTYDVAFTSVTLSRQEGSVSFSEPNEDFTSQLTVNKVSTIRGDVNGDYTVDITDVLVIVDNILGRPNRIFLFANADIDKDGTVNITDALNVVNIILDRKTSEAPRAARVSEYDLLRMGADDMGCEFLTATGIPSITAMQMDIILPADCHLRKVSLTGNATRTHQVMTHQIDDNRYRIVVFSTKKELLNTDAAILHLDIEGRGGMVCAESIQCYNAHNMPILSSDINAILTSISPIYADSDDKAPVYNISGQRVTKKQRGINIVNGSKVVVR